MSISGALSSERLFCRDTNVPSGGRPAQSWRCQGRLHRFNRARKNEYRKTQQRRGKFKEEWRSTFLDCQSSLLLSAFFALHKGNKPVFEKSAIAPVIHLSHAYPQILITLFCHSPQSSHIILFSPQSCLLVLASISIPSHPDTASAIPNHNYSTKQSFLSTINPT